MSEEDETATVGISATNEAVSGVDNAKVSARYYLATQHLWTAKHAARLCEEREKLPNSAGSFDVEHHSNAITAVLSAVAFLEALVNEIFQDVADAKQLDGFSESTSRLMREFWDGGSVQIERSLSVLEKYQLALLCANKEKFATGEDPYQSVHLLIRLRNAWVHFKPEQQDVDTAHAFEKSLKGRFPNSTMPGGKPWYPNQCIGAGCAQWACDVSVTFAEVWSERMGLRRDHAYNLGIFPEP